MKWTNKDQSIIFKFVAEHSKKLFPVLGKTRGRASFGYF